MSDSQRRMYLFLLVTTIASQVGMQGWVTLINNFAVETAGFSAFDMGLAQSIREVPGFLSLLVIYLLLIMTEHRAAALAILVLGLGISITGFLPSFWGIVFTTLIMSTGFHYFEPLNQSLSLQYFSLDMAPVVLGRLRAAKPNLPLLFMSGVFKGSKHSNEAMTRFPGSKFFEKPFDAEELLAAIDRDAHPA